MLRRSVLVAATAAALVAVAAPAWAHVTVTAPDATRGGSDVEITFRMPVEKAVNSTQLTVQLPLTTPLAGVLVRPVTGWTHTQVTSTLAKPIVTDDGSITQAVSQITWKATAGGVKPGEYAAFTIIAGQLPDARTVTFKAIQTYADGSTVNWIETAAPGSTDEPEHPAPVLTLGAAAPADDATGDASSAGHPSSSDSDSDTTALVLSIVALVIAVGAGAVAVLARRRRST